MFLSCLYFSGCMSAKKVLREVLQALVPSKDERSASLKSANGFLEELNAELKKQNIRAKAVLGGSYAKDVWLSGDYDVDIFVKFDVNQKVQDMSALLEKV